MWKATDRREASGTCYDDGSGYVSDANAYSYDFPKRKNACFEISLGELDIPKDVKDIISKSGIIRDGNGNPHIDPNPMMRPYMARGYMEDHGILWRMVYGDGTCNSVFAFFLCEAHRAFWEFEEWDDATEEEKKAVALMNRVFGFDGHESTWVGGFRDLITMAMITFIIGFSDVEWVTDWMDLEIDGKTERYIVPTRNQWIAPWSIKGNVYRNGQPVAIWQKTVNPNDSNPDFHQVWEETDQIIPYDQVLHFSHRYVPGNMAGFPVLRPAYTHVMAKYDTIKRDQAAQDRLFGGIVIVKETGDANGRHKSISKTDSRRMSEMLTAFSKGLSNKMIVPFGLDVVVDFPSFDAPNHINDLKYYDHQILISCLASLLGMDSSNANRSLSDGITAIAYHMVEDFVDEIAAIINGNGLPWTGLVSKTIRGNFANYKGRMPKLRAVGISSQDYKKETEENAHAAQFTIYTPDEKDELRYRKRRRLRTPSVAQVKANREQVAKRNQQIKQGDQKPQKDTLKPGQQGASGNDKKDKQNE